jgi:transcriptional regulator with XRE-family HTH domain
MTEKTTGRIGDLIREQRKLAQLSLREVAAMTRVSNAYLSQVERGLHEPSLRVLNAVAEALKVPLESMVPTAPDSADENSTPAVENAVRMDPWLGPDEKTALLTIYRSMVAHKISSSGATAPHPEFDNEVRD